MRGIANLRSFKSLIAVAAATALLSAARDGLAASHEGPKAGEPLEAVLHPVNRATGDVNEKINLGTARFKQGSGKVEVVLQVNGMSVAGSEQGAAADGTGNVYPRKVEIFAGTCEAAAKTGSAGAARLQDLNLRSDGSGTLFASTDIDMAKLPGQTVLIKFPDKPSDFLLACGVIKGS